MPRMRRLESPGSLHHIMAHSVEHKDMFRNDEDRHEFLSRLEKGLKKTGFQCYTWTLMDNHYHMLIRANHLKLEKLMRGLNGGYAQYYNRKYGKRGYLFQDRFKSALCQDQNYAAQLIKYINLNPLRAGKVKSLEQLTDYTWCGHGYLLNQRGALGETFQNRIVSLSRFGQEEIEAMDNYLKFLEENYVKEKSKQAGKLPITESIEISKSCKGWPAVIGDPDYVTSSLQRYCSDMNRKHREVDYHPILVNIAEWVCKKHKIDDLFKRGRQNSRSKARIEFCHHSHRDELIPPSAIAKYLKITIGPVLRMIDIGDCIEKDKPTATRKFTVTT
ncbi:transposase [Chitinispirillum alkaliphilum]|nr:transposase [Chitinispirillum alkaliphilum]